MNVSMLQRARKLFLCDYVPVHTQRHNMRQWIRSVRYLGNKWLLANPVNRGSPNF